MKLSGLKGLCVLSVMAVIAGCAEGSSGSSNNPEPVSCTKSTCVDATHLDKCDNGVLTPNVECVLGCADDACMGSQCTTSYCEGNVLAQCTNGNLTRIPCANGCDGMGCKSTTGNACVQSVCQGNRLLNCVNGIQSPMDCPYGCENGACKSACTMDVCKDGGTLSMCENGIATDVPCALGCSMGKCNSACTSDFCRDNSILMVCSEGKVMPANCPYGCENNRCNSATQNNCNPGSFSCDGAYVLTCVGGNWAKASNPCPNGCENGACKSSGEPSAPCTNGDLQCNGNRLELCSNGSWTLQENCTNGCENKACKSSGEPSDTCSNGDKKCDGNTLKVCANKEWASYSCANGCENNACKVVTTDKFMTCEAYNANAQAPCAMQNGTSCIDFCASQGLDTCCVNLNTGMIDCACEGPGAKCDSTYKETCDGNTGSYCQGGEVTKFECTDNTQCIVDSAGTADCHETCKSGDKDKYYCFEYYGYAYIAYKEHCEQSGSSYVYNVDKNDYTVCEGECNETVGCVGQTPTTCTDNDLQCNGNKLEVCSGGEWTLKENCTNGCENKACVSSTTTCSNGDLKCDGNKLMLCQNSSWKEQDNCQYGCENKACKQAPETCTNNDLQCNGNKLEVCKSGEWTLKENCTNGCENKACKAPATTCTNNDLQCNGSRLEICSGGSWTLKETCTNGCENKACKQNSVTIPNVGDDCLSSAGDVCDGNTLYYCTSSYKIAKLDCSSSRKCIKSNVFGHTDCMLSPSALSGACTAEGEMLMYNEGTCEDFGAVDGTMSAIYCEKIDGQFYGVDVYADSICYEDEELGTIALMCDGDTDEDIVYTSCSTSCIMSTEAQIDGNDVVAVCDGNKIML